MIPIFYHDIVTPSGHPGDEVISALQKFIRRGETELAVRAAYELYLTEEELTKAGVAPGTVRLSIGLENIKDILADLQLGFDAARAATA